MPQSSDDAVHSEISRRWLLRGGAVAAGAAVVAAVAPTAAEADDGDAVTLGQTNEATATTTVSLTGSAATTNATLALVNADGPTLSLEPSASWESPPELEMGQIANTILGPYIGVDSFSAGVVTSYLATGIDLDDLPTPYALPEPVRLLDTRTSAGRAGILRGKSPSPLDSSGKLRAREWIDVEIAVQDGLMDVPAAHLNLIAIPDASGYVSVYPPGPFPSNSTVYFAARQATANAAFVSTTIVLGRYAVRIYSSALTHLVLELSGVTIKGAGATSGGATKSTISTNKRQGPSKGRRTRLAERLLTRLSR